MNNTEIINRLNKIIATIPKKIDIRDFLSDEEINKIIQEAINETIIKEAQKLMIQHNLSYAEAYDIVVMQLANKR